MKFLECSTDTADRGTKYEPDGAGARYSFGDDFMTAPYRYHLWRVWDYLRAPALFIMLNPSTATHLELDPTLRRCKGFAIDWGYGGFEVCNIFAYRATDPKNMMAAPDPIGPMNDEVLAERAGVVHAQGGVIVAAWSQHGKFMGRAEVVRSTLRHKLGVPLSFLKMGANNMPQHPLYLSKDLKPVEWK